MAKILIADDEPDLRALLTDLLGEAGHEVSVAENGQAALQLMQEEVPDLLLLDVFMPLMDGIQVFQHLRLNPATESLPVIVITAFQPFYELNDLLGSPNTYFVTKPWVLGMLKSTVDLALAQIPVCD